MQTNLEDLLQFIRGHRSNEMNFARLNQKLQEWIAIEKEPAHKKELMELNEKQAAAYLESREQQSSDWPLFEHFVQEFETIVLRIAKQDQRT